MFVHVRECVCVGVGRCAFCTIFGLQYVCMYVCVRVCVRESVPIQVVKLDVGQVACRIESVPIQADKLHVGSSIKHPGLHFITPVPSRALT